MGGYSGRASINDRAFVRDLHRRSDAIFSDSLSRVRNAPITSLYAQAITRAVTKSPDRSASRSRIEIIFSVAPARAEASSQSIRAGVGGLVSGAMVGAKSVGG